MVGPSAPGRHPSRPGSMPDFRSLCVFCGSRHGNDPRFTETARRLGVILAENRIRLVYGGGAIGLMGEVARAALDAGGEVVGVIPNFLKEAEIGMTGLTESYHVDSMHERKQRMFDMSDGFVVLPGGLGTLDESMEILTWRQLRQHDKPVVFLDTAGYWSVLMGLVDHVVEQGFAAAGVRDLYTVVPTADDILPRLRELPPPRRPGDARKL